MKYIILISLLVVGCSKPSVEIRRSTRNECTTIEQKREVAAFILKCAEAANPKSDEEGEDLVIECRRTGLSVLCPTQEVCQTVSESGGFFLANHTNYGDWGPCK